MYLRYGNAKGVDQNIYKYVLEIISNTVTAGSQNQTRRREEGEEEEGEEEARRSKVAVVVWQAREVRLDRETISREREVQCTICTIHTAYLSYL